MGCPCAPLTGCVMSLINQLPLLISVLEGFAFEVGHTDAAIGRQFVPTADSFDASTYADGNYSSEVTEKAKQLMSLVLCQMNELHIVCALHLGAGFFPPPTKNTPSAMFRGIGVLIKKLFYKNVKSK